MGANCNRPPDSRCAFEPCVRGELNQPRAMRPNHIRTRASAYRSEANAAATSPRGRQPLRASRDSLTALEKTARPTNQQLP